MFLFLRQLSSSLPFSAFPSLLLNLPSSFPSLCWPSPDPPPFILLLASFSSNPSSIRFPSQILPSIVFRFSHRNSPISLLTVISKYLVHCQIVITCEVIWILSSVPTLSTHALATSSFPCNVCLSTCSPLSFNQPILRVQDDNCHHDKQNVIGPS